MITRITTPVPHTIFVASPPSIHPMYWAPFTSTVTSTASRIRPRIADVIGPIMVLLLYRRRVPPATTIINSTSATQRSQSIDPSPTLRLSGLRQGEDSRGVRQDRERVRARDRELDRKSTRLNSSHGYI